MIRHPEVKKRYQKEIHEFNKKLGSYEQIRKYEFMDSEWSIQSGELTANLKLRRNYICNKYKTVIEKLFDIKD